MTSMNKLLLSLFTSVFALTSFAAEQYKLGPDSQPQPGVPVGKVMEYEWNNSKIYPGTVRKYWVYVPAQYNASKPACLMVFQDGARCVGRDGPWRVPVAFDNLIAKKEMPVTIGVFIEPGDKVKPGESPVNRGNGMSKSPSNRSLEYDSLGDTYSRFLMEEILPEVGKSVELTKDPAGRAIAGASSGAICAFTVAWERPDQFSKVFSAIGSYTNIRGGNAYPEMVRKSPKKPIRIFQQDGSNDIVNKFGSWPEANKAMAAALTEKGYDHKFVFGEGVHSGNHGTQLFPEAMRWMWRDYAK
ncbi:MAG: Endo,4-beta-xylanase precursor [Verrucomicrobiota bacterium]